MKILLPFDFSDNSENALAYVLKMSKTYDTELHILNVMKPFENVDNNVYNALYFTDYAENKKELLDKSTNKYLNRYPSIKEKTKRKVVSGFIVSEILAYSLKENIDLIVIGSSGIKPSEDFFLGSTTATLASKTQIPLLLIPPTVHAPKYKNVSFASDLKPEMNPQSLTLLTKFLAPLKSKIHLLHVEKKPDTKNENWEKIEKIFVNHKTERHSLYFSDVTEGISWFLKTMNVDLLIAVRQKHFLLHKLLFTRQTKQIIRSLKSPVLLLTD
ncbi:MAG: universal stress protein [Saprospiraceae bacterium]|nr:universal stress protein [Saprospiraceae bacterium]